VKIFFALKIFSLFFCTIVDKNRNNLNEMEEIANSEIGTTGKLQKNGKETLQLLFRTINTGWLKDNSSSIFESLRSELQS
jgi:hypothetical protein